MLQGARLGFNLILDHPKHISSHSLCDFFALRPFICFKNRSYKKGPVRHIELTH